MNKVATLFKEVMHTGVMESSNIIPLAVALKLLCTQNK